MKPKPKVKLCDTDYRHIKDQTLALYKDLDIARNNGQDVFWGRCAAQAVIGVLIKKGLIDFELDLPSPDWRNNGD